MNELSVLFVTDSVNAKHGVAKAGRFILKALALNVNNLIVYSNDCDFDIQQLTNKIKTLPKCIKIPTKPLFTVGVGSVGPRTLARWFGSLYNFIHWQFKSKEIQSDLIFVNGLSVSNPLWARIKTLSSGKKILIVHESPRHYLASHLISKDDAIAAMKEFDAFIFVSSRCRDEWMATPTLHSIPSYYIPNCSDENLATQILSLPKQETRASLKFPKDSLCILCVGSLQPRKGQDILIDNISTIMQVNNQINLYFVGSDLDGWSLQLKKKINRNHLAKKIHFIPFQSNAMTWIYSADLLIVPSRSEALPLVILEAMILNTPVIASNVDGIPELIKNNKTGWLFNIEDPSTFHNALLDALDCKKRFEIVKNANSFYWNNFSQNQLSQRYQLFLHEQVFNS